jgi:diacylglycerol kinase family enzyme
VYVTTRQTNWQAALDDPGQLVVVAGGDGTVAKVARQLAGSGIPIALLPLGTANNIGTSLGATPTRSDEPLSERWRSAHAITVDVGAVAGPWGECAFLESVGCGLFADLLARELRAKKSGKSAPTREDAVQQARRKLADALRHTGPRGWRVEWDGSDRSGEYLLVEVMNISRIGPSLALAPDADPGDGELDVVFMREEDRASFDAFFRKPVSAELRPPRLPSQRAREVVLGAGSDPVHIDDRVPHEKGSTTPLTGLLRLRVHARSLTFLIS